MKKITFTKMQALGNDAIIIDCLKGLPPNPNHFARKVCDRRYGIGADQLLLLIKSRKADYGVKIYNIDGSEAEMCGNGLRCLGRFLHEHKFTTKKEIQIETLAGIRTVRMASRMIDVDMGEPIMKGKDIPVNLSGRVVNRPIRIDTKEFRVTCLSVGNPHCIIFQEDLTNFPFEKYGPLLEHHSVFPKRANVSFVNVRGPEELEVRVWERGAGETQACGSAACASAVAGVLNGFTGRSIVVRMPGGKLEVKWDQEDNHLWLRGPAETVFTGVLEIA
ncbi:MAG: diaminopimelate epimerase [Deltaproteobacteria bacterium]|nr:diaminopimelate epimerase [Deltaproteobacteria bacterium]